MNGILYAVSGNSADGSTVNTVGAYDPSTDTWTTAAPIPTARILHKPQGINGVLYVAGAGAGNTAISTLEAFTITVPFAAFMASVEIEMGTSGAKEDEFHVEGTFTLSSTSNGINPATEEVKLYLNQFSITIPPGSVVGDPVNGWELQGIINGVEMEAQIEPLGPPGSYEFTVQGQQADLTGMQNPVTVTLTIGADSGSATVGAQF